MCRRSAAAIPALLNARIGPKSSQSCRLENRPEPQTSTASMLSVLRAHLDFHSTTTYFALLPWRESCASSNAPPRRIRA